MQAVSAHGAEIPVLGLGTWTLKGDDCVAMVDAAIKAGYRHIDTAIMYDNEGAVGEGIRSSGAGRDSLFLTSKVWYTDIGPGDLQRAAEASLRRLDVDTLDLLLIHWPNPDIPLAQSIKALNEVRKSGMTRHIGVSNFTTSLLDEAWAATDAPLVCNQVEYHPLLDQSKVHAACRSHGMAMTSYCPLGRGGDVFEAEPVRAAAAAHGKTPAQIVLRWHIQQDGVAAIPRTSKPERLAENAAIFDFALGAEEMDAISALKSRNQRICDYDFSPEWDRAD
ncbi:aldo/keto reductase [Pararhizobium haloflavum]|uniref:aldo/keto reductase n=1 Tax=Pararhizobium haloflavum TaxID=2037914 RepID=UPI000C198383|nr:aldo/keto reductase [Pararhizobium haloflavum]